MRRKKIDVVDPFLAVVCYVFGNAQSHGRAKVNPSSAEGCFLQGEQMNRTSSGQHIIAGPVCDGQHTFTSLHSGKQFRKPGCSCQHIFGLGRRHSGEITYFDSLQNRPIGMIVVYA